MVVCSNLESDKPEVYVNLDILDKNEFLGTAGFWKIQTSEVYKDTRSRKLNSAEMEKWHAGQNIFHNYQGFQISWDYPFKTAMLLSLSLHAAS